MQRKEPEKDGFNQIVKLCVHEKWERVREKIEDGTITRSMLLSPVIAHRNLPLSAIMVEKRQKKLIDLILTKNLMTAEELAGQLTQQIVLSNFKSTYPLAELVIHYDTDPQARELLAFFIESEFLKQSDFTACFHHEAERSETIPAEIILKQMQSSTESRNIYLALFLKLLEKNLLPIDPQKIDQMLSLCLEEGKLLSANTCLQRDNAEWLCHPTTYDALNATVHQAALESMAKNFLFLIGFNYTRAEQMIELLRIRFVEEPAFCFSENDQITIGKLLMARLPEKNDTSSNESYEFDTAIIKDVLKNYSNLEETAFEERVKNEPGSRLSKLSSLFKCVHLLEDKISFASKEREVSFALKNSSI